MDYAIQQDFIIIFILIYLYLIVRILVNTKHHQANVVKELFLTGFIISIIYLISFTIFSISKTSGIIKENNFIPFKSIYYLFINNNILDSINVLFKEMILFLPIGFFVYPCIEFNIKDSTTICLLFTLAIGITHIVNPHKIINIDILILDMFGSFIGILISYNLTKKRGCLKIKR